MLEKTIGMVLVARCSGRNANTVIARITSGNLTASLWWNSVVVPMPADLPTR